MVAATGPDADDATQPTFNGGQAKIRSNKGQIFKAIILHIKTNDSD